MFGLNSISFVSLRDQVLVHGATTIQEPIQIQDVQGFMVFLVQRKTIERTFVHLYPGHGQHSLLYLAGFGPKGH